VESLQPVPRPHVSFRAAAVTKVFGETVALWSVDLDGRSGELIAVHGANGSGKTTLLRIVAGLVAPTRGRVLWTTTAPGRRPRIGLLGHAAHLFDELTTFENISLAARLARRDQAVAIDLLRSLGVGQYWARRAGLLSAGTRRRVGLARTLATDPDVLVVDEPFAGLDRSAADNVERVLAEIRDEGRLVLIATHDDARSLSIATRTVRLEEGRIRPHLEIATEATAT
jgi:ABC-type multidrug transport system ATPase subunit